MQMYCDHDCCEERSLEDTVHGQRGDTNIYMCPVCGKRMTEPVNANICDD